MESAEPSVPPPPLPPAALSPPPPQTPQKPERPCIGFQASPEATPPDYYAQHQQHWQQGTYIFKWTCRSDGLQ